MHDAECDIQIRCPEVKTSTQLGKCECRHLIESSISHNARITLFYLCRHIAVQIWFDFFFPAISRLHYSLVVSAVAMQVSTPRNILFCRMTNYELLRWLVETRSRDVGHYRMINASRSTVCHYNDKRSRHFQPRVHHISMSTHYRTSSVL